MPLFKKSLLSRIVVHFLLLSTLIVGLLTAFSYSFFVIGAEKRVTRQLEGLAEIKLQAIRRWIEEKKRDVVSLSRVKEITDGYASLVKAEAAGAGLEAASRGLLDFFMTMHDNAEVMDVIIAAGREGRVLFSMDRYLRNRYAEQWNVAPGDMEHTSVGKVYLSPVTLRPTLTISAPLKTPDGRGPPGTLAVNLDLDAIGGIVDDPAGLDSCEAYLVDSRGMFVSSGKMWGRSYPRRVHSDGIDQAVRGVDGSGLYRDYNGVPVIGVYRFMPQRGLALMVEISQEQALQPARHQTAILVFIGIAMELAAAGGVYFLARQITAPIRAVRQAALRVAEGDLHALAPVSARDEIGELAESFNRMTDRTRGLYEELKRKEEYYRSLIETSTDIVVVFDDTLAASFVSSSVERILGYRPEELVGKNIGSVVHPEEMEGFLREADRIRYSGERFPAPVTLRVAHKNGGWRVLEITGRNLCDHPAIMGIVAAARDVTDRQQLEDKLAHSQKMEAVGRLAGGIAHDFNNLLTAVLGYADILLEGRSVTEDARDHVMEIRNAANRAAALTQQLLAYSRKQALQPKIVDLNRLVSGMRNMLGRLIGEDVKLLTRFAGDLQRVRVDQGKLELVVMNLALNARDAMPQGGTILLETSNAAPGDELPGRYVKLTVSDTGVGMDGETVKNAFDPFFTTKDLGKGTGLGLSTAYGIVKQSGGHIAVNSEVGKGSSFTVYLPAAVAAADEPEEERAEEEAFKGSEAILVVEDEDSVRKMMRTILSQAGYNVHTESDPRNAMLFADSADGLDLLVTDMVLPGMNGRALADILLARRPGLKVMFISGYAEEAMMRHGSLPEGPLFLQKPFSPRDLHRKVREILDRS